MGAEQQLDSKHVVSSLCERGQRSLAACLAMDHSFSSVYYTFVWQCNTILHCMSGNGSELFTLIVQSIAEHVAVKYNALHCTAMSGNATLQVTLCSVIQSIAVNCRELQCITLCCNQGLHCTQCNQFQKSLHTDRFCAKLGEDEYELTQQILFNSLWHNWILWIQMLQYYAKNKATVDEWGVPL